jgi:hypothetical protein
MIDGGVGKELKVNENRKGLRNLEQKVWQGQNRQSAQEGRGGVDVLYPAA